MIATNARHEQQQKKKENKNWKQNTQIIHIVRGQEDTYV